MSGTISVANHQLNSPLFVVRTDPDLYWFAGLVDGWHLNDNGSRVPDRFVYEVPTMSEFEREDVELQFIDLPASCKATIIYGLWTKTPQSLNDLYHIEMDASTVGMLLDMCHKDEMADRIPGPWFRRFLMLVNDNAQLGAITRLPGLIDLYAQPLDVLCRLHDECHASANWVGEDWQQDMERYLDDYDDIIDSIAILDEIVGHSSTLPIYKSMRQLGCHGSNCKPGFVYLLKSDSGHWKIGRTVNPKNRMKTFGIQLPYEVEYEHLIPTSHMAQAERVLQAHFGNKRINGEWFALTADDVKFIKSIERLAID